MNHQPSIIKIAIVGSGISGLSTAWHLMEMSKQKLDITIFEKDDRLGGHTNTIDITLDGIQAPVDTGFLVCNERTYPLFIPFLQKIGVPLVATDMSFAVSVGPHQFEWCGSNLSGLFSQPSNAFSLRFWRMLKDVLRFNKEATQMAQSFVDDNPELTQAMQMPLREFLLGKGYSEAFRDDYLVPMAAAIWSCPTKSMLEFPVGSFVRFFHNHGLLQVTNRPRWFTVPGGAKQYVQKIQALVLAAGGSIKTNAGVTRITRNGPVDAHPNQMHRAHITLETLTSKETFDHVIMACHSNQSLKLLADITHAESQVLKAIPYQANIAYLHTDEQLMPKRRQAWAAWNYLSQKRGSDQEQSVSVTYWLNRLQPLPFKTPVFVSLNPITTPRPETVIQAIGYEHPVFDGASTQAQAALLSVQGTKNTWYAGAWTGYGFHEDGFASGKLAAQALMHRLAADSVRQDHPVAA
jgi:uncharacterized protein